jgi:hypothetical protein
MEPDAEVDDEQSAPRMLTPEQEREVVRARRDIKLVGIASIGLIGLMIVLTVVAALLTYAD